MQASPVPAPQPRIVGRYALYGEIAAGGMATVHFGRLVGAVGFSRTVAIKRLHPQFARDPDFVQMFLDEARLAARIQHPNVVSTLDVVPLDEEVFLVMEYVHGEALSKLIRATRRNGQLVPPRIAVAIMAGALTGLHAAHEAKSERGEPLNIVHRDVSPQNILIGTDGVPRVLDFGVAKAAARATSTRDGQMKGKVSYMAPEQLRGRGVDRRTDVFAAGVVLWETLTGRRLFDGDDPGEVLTKLLEAPIPPPSHVEPSIPPHLDGIVLRALDRDINGRYPTAREFAIALEQAGPIAMQREVGEWVEYAGGETVGSRARLVAEIEHSSSEWAAVAVPVSQQPFSGRTMPGPGYPPASMNPALQGEPTTSPSQVSHVTGVSHPSATFPSQITSPSAMHAQPAGSRKSVFAALLGVAAAMAVALVVFVVILVGRARRTAPEQSDVVPVGPQPSSVPAPTTSAEAEPTAPPIVSVEPPSSAEPPVEEPKPVAQKPPVTSHWKPPSKQPTKPPTTSKPATDTGCDPPFFVDKNGVRRVKPGCM